VTANPKPRRRTGVLVAAARVSKARTYVAWLSKGVSTSGPNRLTSS